MGAVLPIFRPALPPVSAVAPYLEEMDHGRIYSNGGPLVRRLERRYADFLGVPEDLVVAVSSGTTGITASVLAVDAVHWIIPDWTFAATPSAVLRAAKTITFADVDRESGILDLGTDLEPSLETGLLPVMPFGSFAHARNLIQRERVVLDAAASLPNARGRLGHLADKSAVVFSLHATKILGCGEGGLVVCGSRELAVEVRSIINFGFDAHRESVRAGFNGKMPEISAAWALAALDRADEDLPRWQEQAFYAREASLGLPLNPFSPAPHEVGPYWVVTSLDGAIQMPVTVLEDLNAAGVEARRWWPKPCSSMPAFMANNVHTPNAHWLARNTIGLPMSIDMRPNDFVHIRGALTAALGRQQF
jgi:dTDP-4-amino-4,6-dideoxygalactose transaminase